jgi:predicted amidohydrolase
LTIYRIDIAHMNPLLACLEDNRRQVEEALDVAIKERADWLITPELCLSGYYFEEKIGTDWITVQPDSWAQKLFKRAGANGVTVFLSCAERDAKDGKCYNAVLVASPKDVEIKRHRKIAIQKVSEEWSSKGSEIDPIDCGGVKVGILICADTWPDSIARQMKEKGARLFISPAAWPPEPCSPDGCWEKRSAENEVPLWVCNRTGHEAKLDFRKGETVLIKNGSKILVRQTEKAELLLFDWDMSKMELKSDGFTIKTFRI